MIKRLVSVAGIGMGGLAAAVVVAGMAGGCAKGQGSGSGEMTIDPSNPNVRRAWMADLGLKGDTLASLYQTSEHVFVCTGNNQVMALSRTGGALQWGDRVGEAHTAILPPLEVGDQVVFPVNTRMFLYSRNGVLDRAQEVGFAMAAPGVTDGKNMVYMPASRGDTQRMAAVDVRRQVLPVVWEFVVDGPVTARPAMEGGVLYVGTEGNRVYAVAQGRRPVWSLEGFAFETGGRIVADLKADDFGVYVASTDTKLYCLDRMNGRIKWTWYGEGQLTTPPFVTSDVVYQYSPAKGLCAIEKTAGVGARTERWNQPEAVQVLSAGERGVYVRFRDNSIGALEKGSGKVMWRGAHKYARFISNERDALMIVATGEGAVHAYLPVGEARPERVVRAAAVQATTGPVKVGGQQQVAP